MTMKLSEAIRLGATMKPQCFGNLYWHGGSCAIGAAFDAMGVDALQAYMLDMCGVWPIMESLNTKLCPECDRPIRVQFTVTHLNDTHMWTRERIADWVEIVEFEQEINKEQPIKAESRQHEIESTPNSPELATSNGDNRIGYSHGISS